MGEAGEGPLQQASISTIGHLVGVRRTRVYLCGRRCEDESAQTGKVRLHLSADFQRGSMPGRKWGSQRQFSTETRFSARGWDVITASPTRWPGGNQPPLCFPSLSRFVLQKGPTRRRAILYTTSMRSLRHSDTPAGTNVHWRPCEGLTRVGCSMT